jgi:hypothetical protein
MPDTLPAGDVKLPGGKKVPKKYLIVLGGGAVLYVGYRWYSGGSAPAAVGAIDPETADLTMPIGGGGSASGGSGGYAEAAQTEAAAATNATWSQRAQELLEAAGWGAQPVAVALGAYLSGQPLTQAQALMIQAALALNGRPPQGTFTIVHTTAEDPVVPDHSGEKPPEPAPVPVPTATTKPTFSAGLIQNAIPTQPSGSVATKPAGTPTGLTGNTEKNESMGSFQGRVYAKRGFSPTLVQLRKLNPTQQKLLEQMDYGDPHPYGTLKIS